MNRTEIVSQLKGLLAENYPDISIRIEPWKDDPTRDAIYFEEEKFGVF